MINDGDPAGHAGMEALIANLIEPGETIVVGNNGAPHVRRVSHRDSLQIVLHQHGRAARSGPAVVARPDPPCGCPEQLPIVQGSTHRITG